MNTPQIATILEDGTYGQRDMTEEEIAAYLELLKTAPTPPAETGRIIEP